MPEAVSVTSAGRRHLGRAREIAERIPPGHPRLPCRLADLGRLRSPDPELAALLRGIRADAEAVLDSPEAPIVLPADLLIPGGESWDQRYPSTLESFSAHERMMAPLRRAFRLIPGCSLCWLVGGESRFRDRARAALRELAALDLVRTSYTNTHQFHGVIPTLALGLDLLWGELEPTERESIVEALVARALEFHRLTVQLTFDDPLNSHHISYGPPDMLDAALALVHHREESVLWLADILAYLEEVFPAFGGDDGGWAQGFGYIFTHYYQKMANRILSASGVDFFDRPWARNNRNLFLYFRPPWSTVPSFGDVGYADHQALNRQIMSSFADVYGDPYCAWYAASVAKAPPPSLDALMHRLLRPAGPPPRPPSELPSAIHLRDVGWVAMHDQLGDPERNVMLCFKSSRFGSWSHSHADQNSFILEAFGRPLLIDSGYYPWYGSPHDITWSRNTRAHNAVLFDGKGQGLWSLAASGRIMSFVHTAEVDYVSGDATAAYREGPRGHGRREIDIPQGIWACDAGVLRAARHILYVRPGLIFIVDDVETERPMPIELQFHASVPFAIQEASRAAVLSNPPAHATLTFPGNEPLALSQTDHFPVPPEAVRGQSFPQQWHLTARFGPLRRSRLLLSCITVSRDGERPLADETCWEGSETRVSACAGGWRIDFESLADEAVSVACTRVDGADGLRMTAPRGAPGPRG